MSQWYIYGLRESAEGSPYRYVGYTTDTLNGRLALHLLQARKSTRPYAVYDWVRSKDLDITCDLLEEMVAGDKNLLYTRERYWIAHFRGLQGSLTDRLTDQYLLNHTDGGGGALGYKHTEEECARRKTQTGYWAGITGEANPNYGRKMTDEQREKLSLAKQGKPAHNKGKPASEQAKLKMSFTRHSRFHSEKINTKCMWCLGADLHEEIQKRENEPNDIEMG